MLIASRSIGEKGPILQAKSAKKCQFHKSQLIVLWPYFPPRKILHHVSLVSISCDADRKGQIIHALLLVPYPEYGLQ